MIQTINNNMRNSIFLATLATLFAATAQAQLPTPNALGYANVNGQKIYYETYGEGPVVLLLHGAYMTIALNWTEIIPGLAKNHKVVAIEVQGHGHTPWTNRPLSFDALAGDVDKILQFLKIDSADVVGYSYGGTIAYNVAAKYPKRVKKLVIISSTWKFDGWQKEVRDALHGIQPEMFLNTSQKVEYDKVAPDKTQWKDFVYGMVAFTKKGYDLGEENVYNIKSPTLLICGDNDGIDKNILLDTYKHLGGLTFADFTGVPKSQLAIVPGKGHVSLMEDTENILKLLTQFLQ
jgi:pimeloyl-ACP methyl ester carboxylesterase